MRTQQIQAQQSLSTQSLSTQSLSTAVALFSERVPNLAPSAILRQGLDLIRQRCSADQVMLYSTLQRRVTPLGTVQSNNLPSTNQNPDSYSTDWFPWGLHIAPPLRFLFVQDAQMLPADPTSGHTLGQIGLRSCLHLTIRERQQPIGALHLYWSESRPNWDDSKGQILRSLGRLLLTASSEAALAPHLNSSRPVRPD